MFGIADIAASFRLGSFFPLFAGGQSAHVLVASFGAPLIVGEAFFFTCVGAALVALVARRRLATLRRTQRQEEQSLAYAGERLQRDLDLARAHLQVVRQAGDALSFGITVLDSSGRDVLRNPEVASFLGPDSGLPDGESRVDRRSDGEVMAGGTLRRLLERAADGHRGRENLDIVGPPRRSFIVTAEPIGDRVNGRFAVVGTVQDASEARRTEAMRQDFITNVSHELRTPVGAIAVLAETLASETDRHAAARLTGRLEHEAHRLAVMVDDLLALGRVESSGVGSEEFVPAPELLDEAIERARVSAATRELTIEVTSVGHGLLVRGDRRQLVTALHNLLENALKYSDKGQPVVVDASLSHRPPGALTQGSAHGASGGLVESLRDDTEPGPCVAISVRDHGIGIPMRDQERIFERFYRVDRARARDTGGSGLGLAIVRHVARNHDGDIIVSSVEGEGSTFTLLLPGYARGGAESTQLADALSAPTPQ